jgi:hypothetical protein
MSMREHAEDPLWWTLKPATAFAAHRRTVLLLRANVSALDGAPNPLTWVDNTGAVWPELRATLAALDPRAVAVNVDSDHAFAGGMAVGELDELTRQLGPSWRHRFVPAPPELATAFVARRVEGMRPYFAQMTETVWAMLEEAFSARVVVPGKTTTEVQHLLLRRTHDRLTNILTHTPRIGPRVVVPRTNASPQPLHLEPPARQGSRRVLLSRLVRLALTRPSRRRPPRRPRPQRAGTRPAHRHAAPRVRPPPV